MRISDWSSDVCSSDHRPDIRFDMYFQVSDVQLLNDHTILHARTDFEDWPEPERKRRLLRIWLNLLNSRELAPEFAERLNNGQRGGVDSRPNVGWNVGRARHAACISGACLDRISLRISLIAT